LAEVLLWIIGIGCVVAAGFLIYPPAGLITVGCIALFIAYIRRSIAAWQEQGSE
jgi:hypothetical protein